MNHKADPFRIRERIHSMSALTMAGLLIVIPIASILLSFTIPQSSMTARAEYECVIPFEEYPLVLPGEEYEGDGPFIKIEFDYHYRDENGESFCTYEPTYILYEREDQWDYELMRQTAYLRPNYPTVSFPGEVMDVHDQGLNQGRFDNNDVLPCVYEKIHVTAPEDDSIYKNVHSYFYYRGWGSVDTLTINRSVEGSVEGTRQEFHQRFGDSPYGQNSDNRAYTDNNSNAASDPYQELSVSGGTMFICHVVEDNWGGEYDRWHYRRIFTPKETPGVICTSDYLYCTRLNEEWASTYSMYVDQSEENERLLNNIDVSGQYAAARNQLADYAAQGADIANQYMSDHFFTVTWQEPEYSSRYRSAEEEPEQPEIMEDPIIQEDTTVAKKDPGEDPGEEINNEIIEGKKDRDTDGPGPLVPGIGGTIVGVGLGAAAKKNKKKEDAGEEQEDDPVTYKMIVYKDFGDSIKPGTTKYVYARIEQYKPIQDMKSPRDDLTAMIQCDSPDHIMTVEDAGITTNGCDWKAARVTVPEGCTYTQGVVSFILPGPGGAYVRNVIFQIVNPAIIFGQENLGLPANHLKNTINVPGGSTAADAAAEARTSGKSPLSVNAGPVARPVDGVFHLPFGIYGMPAEGTTVRVDVEQTCSTDSEGRFIQGSTDHSKGCPYSVTLQRDPEYKDKPLWELLIKEVLDYELPAGTSEGITLHITAEYGKKGTEEYLLAKRDFPLYRIHMGLVLNVDTLSIPCYTELKESGKRKLSAQAKSEADRAKRVKQEFEAQNGNTKTFKAVPNGDDSVTDDSTPMAMSASEEDMQVDPDETKILPEDIQPVFGEGTLVMFVCRESDMAVLRIPVSPSEMTISDDKKEKTSDQEKLPGAPVRVRALKVAQSKKSHIGEADESHQELVDKLQIRAFPTGNLTTSGAHRIKFCATAGALDPPTRIVVEIEVFAEYKKKIHSVTKKVLLRSQPFRPIRTIRDEEKYLKEDKKITENLLHIQDQIWLHALGNLTAVYDMIDRMLEGYDYRFGYDRNQLMNVTSCYLGWIRGTFLGAKASARPVTLADDINACYAFLQGLRDNTGILGRVAMGVMTAGYSEYVFTTMTLAEEMRDRVFACKGDEDFGFWDGVQMGVKEFGKQIIVEALIGGVKIGKSINVPGFAEIGGEYLLKVHNIDMAYTIQMWAGRYRDTMTKADIFLQKRLPLYKQADDILQKGLNFFNTSAKTAKAGIEAAEKETKAAAKDARKFAEEAKSELNLEELKRSDRSRKAAANGKKDVQKLMEAQLDMETCAGDPVKLKTAKAKYKECADRVWTNKNALKQLQRDKRPYADRMRAQFNHYRENLLDEVQLEALGDIAKEIGRNADDLYVMNVSNGINKDYKLGKKVPGDRDISFKQKVLSDKTGLKDLTIDQEIGQRAVARRLFKKMNGREADTLEEALRFMKEKDVTYVNPEGFAKNADGTFNHYVFEHNLEGYEDLTGMVGMRPDASGSRKMVVDKSLMKNDLHNLQINRAAVKNKGTEWFSRDAGESMRKAMDLEARAAKETGAAKQALLDEADLYWDQYVAQTEEGIRQITKQVDKIINVRSQMRTGKLALSGEALRIHEMAKLVEEGMDPVIFEHYLMSKHNMTLDDYADLMASYLT